MLRKFEQTFEKHRKNHVLAITFDNSNTFPTKRKQNLSVCGALIKYILVSTIDQSENISSGFPFSGKHHPACVLARFEHSTWLLNMEHDQNG